MNKAGIDRSFQSDIEKAIEYLKSVGCSEVYLFGSLESGETRADSDIDIVVRGIEPEGLRAEYKGYLGFRHFVRHAYTFEIDSKTIEAILDKVAELARVFIEEIKEQ